MGDSGPRKYQTVSDMLEASKKPSPAAPAPTAPAPAAPAPAAPEPKSTLPYATLAVSFILFVAALAFFFYSVGVLDFGVGEEESEHQAETSPDSGGGLMDRLGLNLGGQETYQELVEKSKRMKSGKFNYSVSLFILNSMNLTIPVQSFKYGDDSKTIISMSLLGSGMTVASYWLNNRSIICTETPSTGEISCSSGGGLSSASSYASLSNVPEADQLKKLQAVFLRKEKILGRQCSLFDVNLSSIMNLSGYPAASSLSSMGMSSGGGQRGMNMTYLICLDDQYGFPSLVEFKTTSYSKLSGETSTNPFLTIALTGFSEKSTYEDILPPEDLDFILNGLKCRNSTVEVNVTFVRERPPFLSVNVTEYDYGEYNYTTGSYSPGEYKTVDQEVFLVPKYEADYYVLTGTVSSRSTYPTILVCSSRHCEKQYCSTYDYSYGRYTDSLYGSTTTTSTGFAKLKPQLAGTAYYSNGSFDSVFTNGVGTSITINNATLTFNDGHSCGLTADETRVLAGENFDLTGTGCGILDEDTYSVEIEIEYRVTIGSIETTHVERGTIRGPVA